MARHQENAIMPQGDVPSHPRQWLYQVLVGHRGNTGALSIADTARKSGGPDTGNSGSSTTHKIQN